MNEDAKWDALDKQSAALRSAAAELSEAVNAFGVAVNSNALKKFATDLNQLSNSEIGDLVEGTGNLPASILDKINYYNQVTETLNLGGDGAQAAQEYLNKANKFAFEATQLNQEMMKTNERSSDLQERFAALQSKMANAGEAKLPSNDESVNTPVEKFAKACARFGAALVTLPLLLAGIAVAIAGSVATLGMWVPGVIIGAGVGIATQDLDSAVVATTLVTQSIALVGAAMFAAGSAAGVYAVHGDNAFKADDENTTRPNY